MTEFNKEYFEILFEHLDEPWGMSYRASQRYRYDLTLSLLQKYQERYASVLDIGCAQGQLTKELLPFADRITAIDISENAIKKVRRDFAQVPNATFEVGCLPELSYPDQTFDMAMAFEILYYIKREELPPSIGEVKRTLKDKGLFFVSVIIDDEPYFKREEIRGLVGKELQIMHEEPLYLKLHQMLEAKFFEFNEKIMIAKKILFFSAEEIHNFFAGAKVTKLRAAAEKILTNSVLRALIRVIFLFFYAVYRVLIYPTDLLFRSMTFLKICNYLTKKLWGEKGVFQVIIVAQKNNSMG